jgi:hypothetical protein
MTHVRAGLMASLTMIALLCPLSPLSAQRAQLTLGQRVRIDSSAQSAYIEGRLVRLVADTLVLTDERREQSVVLGSRFQIWVASGTRVHPAAGAVIGGLVGIVAGALAYSPPPPCTDNFACGVGVMVKGAYGRIGAASLGGLLGMLIGGSVGSQIHSTRWTRVLTGDLDRLRVGLAPLPASRLGVGVSISF